MLAMRVVHGAVVSSLLSESEQDHPGQSEHEDGNEGITADEPKMNLQDVDISCISVQPSYPDEDSLKHRLGELKVQWAEAEARCAEMQASLAQQGEMSCRRVELKIQVAATEQRCKEMQSALSAAEARFAEMQSSSDAEDDFKRHRDEIKTRLAAAEQRCKEMQSALTGAEARFAEMESETAEDVLKRQLSELKIQWAATEARCAEMQTSVTQQDELRSQRDSLKAQLASAEAKCAGLSESQDELRSQRDSLKAQLASAEAKCAGLSESQEASRKTCERLQAELDTARDDESKVQAELGSVKRELDEAKVELAATRAQCATIAATMSQPSQPCDTDFAKQPAEDRDFEVRRMQEEFDRKETCFQAELVRKEEQIFSLEATRERAEVGARTADGTGPVSSLIAKPEGGHGGAGSSTLPAYRPAIEAGVSEMDSSREERRPLHAEPARATAGVCASAREDSASRSSTSRMALSGVQRRLFTHSGPEPGHGQATCASGMTSAAQAGATGPGHGASASMTSGPPPPQYPAAHQLPSARLVSVPPRPSPSPRGVSAQPSGAMQAVTVPPWRSASTCASPRGKGRVHCEVSTPSGPGGNERPPCAVRALVSEFERRSTSQTPGGTARGSMDASPSRPMTMAPTAARAASNTARATHGTLHSTAPSAITATPTSMPMQELARGRITEPDAEPPHSHRDLSHGAAHIAAMREHHAREAYAREDPASSPPPVLGMSPLTRPRDRAAHMRGGIATPSPISKGPSVQDRIRQLYGH
mmetsp:Transcript_156950/g.285638  ORF Transcript_156950/g.285638 Transcript_156950/m.285638 type:complete len:765 (+) Transcript_156950:395-2689(+)